MKIAFTVIRVSEEDQLRGYGPDVQWFDDVLPVAPQLGLEVDEGLRVVIQEPATSWDREKFEAAVREAMRLYRDGRVQALLFPRVDRETRFLFGSFSLLTEVIRSGMEVYFAREKLRLDPDDPESVERYFSKAMQAQAYVETMRLNTMRGKKRRALKDQKMPAGGGKWAFEYVPATGRYQKNEARAARVVKCYGWILEEGLSLRKCCQRLEREGVASPGWEEWRIATERGRKWKKPPRADKWYPNSLRNILLDPANIGRFYAYRHKVVKAGIGKKREVPTDPGSWLLVYEDPGQAIVTPEQHDAMKARMERNKENSSRHTHHPYPPLRGMVRCTLCRRRMYGWTNRNRGTAYYMCQTCRNLINARSLWEELREGIKVRLLEPGRLLPGVKAQLQNGQTLARLEAEEKSLREQLDSWEAARDKARRLYFLKRNYPEEKYLADDRQMEEEQQKVTWELDEVRGQIARLRQAIVDEEGIRRFCEQISRNMDELDENKWRVLLERMRLKVEVTPGEPVVAHLNLPLLSDGDAIVYQSWAS